MKSYTDLEQSRKLAEILPLESADMCFNTHNNMPPLMTPYSRFNEFFNMEPTPAFLIPCWSLSALLNALPPSIPKYINSESCQKTFHLNLFRSHYYCCSYSFNPSISDNDGNNTLYCVGRDNWVDACYEMIIKLHEEKWISV